MGEHNDARHRDCCVRPVGCRAIVRSDDDRGYRRCDQPKDAPVHGNRYWRGHDFVAPNNAH